MYAIGIDIGGTKILGTVIDSSGQIVETLESPTRVQDGKEVVIKSVMEQIHELTKKREVKAIGVGSAGRIDIGSGEVYYATPNLPDWTGVNLVKEINKFYSLPVFVDNDVNTAAYGEYCFGSGKNYRSFVFITLGTGVAASYCQKGKLFRGDHWSAGEVGHIILIPNGRACNCGQRGCFEQYCSGTGLVKAFNEKGLNSISNAQDFFHLVRQGDQVALNVLDQFVDYLAIGLINLSHTYDPEAYIIGGGLIYTKEVWWDSFVKRYQDYSNDAIKNIKLLPATLNNHAGAIGAAKLAIDHL